MKKIILTASMIICFSFGAMAQNDGFFTNWNDNDNIREDNELPLLPSQHGYDNDQNAPIGSGLLILTVLGAGYAMAKRKKD